MKFPLPTFALLIGLAAGLGLTQTATATTQVERAALVRLFDQTGGPNWTNNTNWNGPRVCGFWFGVICDNFDTIVGLDLHNNHLVGRLPALTDLAALSSFDFSQNVLTGPIPALNDLASLQDFNISSNQFSGSIPTLTALTNLRTFDAFSNQLTGPIPALNGLVNLQNLNLGNNQLTGSMVNVQRASGLIVVNLSGNVLTGKVPDLTELTNLRRFNIGGNGLTGQLPAVPPSLTNGLSFLCSNPLVPATNPPSTIDTAWNAATGQSPWSKDCTKRTTLVSVIADNTSAAAGVPVKVSITVSANDGIGLPSGNVTVVDDLDSTAICIAALSPITQNESLGECTVNFTSIGKHTLTAGYPGDFTFAPNSNIAVVINPVLADLELAALVKLFADTDGEHWTRNDNWNNSGDPCAAATPWFGITCSVDRTHVIGLDLHNNRLSGGTSNALTGGALAIEGLRSLRTLNISTNQLRGVFPNLNFTNNLQFVLADHNGFISTPIPPMNGSLVNGASKLCPNAFTPAITPPSNFDNIWNAATGTTPWSKDCVQREVKISANANPNPAHIGDIVTFSIIVAPRIGTGTPTGSVKIADALAPQDFCTSPLIAGSTSCTLKFASNGIHQVVTDYEGDNLFALNQTSTQQIVEALPDSERAVLDALFLQTDGPNWTDKTNWPYGESCKRYAVICDVDGTHVVSIQLFNNNLFGSLPSLSALASLQLFDFSGNQLRGSIPPLVGLNSLETFDVSQNQLTGSIPDLTGIRNLKALVLFNNSLTGSIPALTDQVSLLKLNVGGNGLTGTLVAPPPSIGLQASLCPNPLPPSAEPPSAIDIAWNAITGKNPWSKDCNLSAALVTLSATPNPVKSNSAVAITVTVDPVPGGTGAPDGTVTIADSLDLDVSCTVTLKDGRGACGLILVKNGTHTLTAGYSGSASLSHGSGSAEVIVLASINDHTIGGAVSGLAGTGLVLSLNAGAQTLAIPANGGFVFPAELTDGSSYAVSVVTQPIAPVQICTVANGSGNVAGDDVSTIKVNCSATSFTVNAQAGPSGTITPSGSQAVAAGTPVSFTVRPDAGHMISAVAGCGGGLSQANVYTTAPVNADCTVTASFSAGPVNGACGTDNGQILSAQPVRLCSAGTPSAVLGSGPWTWTCAGSSGGTTASCAANAAVLTGTTTTLSLNPNPVGVNADVTASVNVLTIASLASTFNPAISAMPGGTVQISDGAVTCTAPPSGSCVLRFATPGVHAVTATYGGDANFAASSITINETVNAPVQGNVAQIPTLSEWLLDLLGAVLACTALIHLHRRISPRFLP
ncbi:hypothetical protein ELE36_13020 [Pseudolysobacter antarcticus]|uniref:Bacterial Ig-like domain-containing protein n=1 Tax=Pseudolysobacter antarcticus TaxID=2511995 RepID=A0A411HKZ4_9GAMM|nr:Ig-like domain repeat protein [Pseudolysobacter antarcticus]QBB71199.1 hypothetical protein ELE36_13020 [Pseudolysobacter antarcticus]